jgi:hypothetical protein
MTALGKKRAAAVHLAVRPGYRRPQRRLPAHCSGH